MREFYIYLSKYLFIAVILAFLVCLWFFKKPAERKKIRTITLDLLTFALHIPAFWILCSMNENTEIPALGIAMFFLLVFAFVTLPIVYRNTDSLVFNAVFFLIDIGIIMLSRLNPGYAGRQLLFCAIGFVLVLAMPLLIKLLKKPLITKWLSFFVSLGLLGSLFLLGKDNYGAVNWIEIAPGLGFQPSEFVKITFVLYLASAFSKPKDSSSYVVPILFAGITILMLVMQKDLGGALIFFMTFLAMFYTASGSKLITFLGFIAFTLASFLAYQIFPHVVSRIDIWLNPWSDMSGRGYQLTQSLFAITNNGLTGSGLTKGVPYIIPFVEKDVLFSAIFEEFGQVFGLSAMGIFLYIFRFGADTAKRQEDSFRSLMVLGFTVMLAVQTLTIVGGVTGALPLTGVTLPFVSYGGSSMLSSMIMIGILCSVANS